MLAFSLSFSLRRPSSFTVSLKISIQTSFKSSLQRSPLHFSLNNEFAFSLPRPIALPTTLSEITPPGSTSFISQISPFPTSVHKRLHASGLPIDIVSSPPPPSRLLSLRILGTPSFISSCILYPMKHNMTCVALIATLSKLGIESYLSHKLLACFLNSKTMYVISEFSPDPTTAFTFVPHSCAIIWTLPLLGEIMTPGSFLSIDNTNISFDGMDIAARVRVPCKVLARRALLIWGEEPY
mmetsp:Transcript_16360/g.20699  ORF Transcript_16360/g.20699 Transcript_16360/m.20699 type:complete len:239 (+) Transcript_16360:823-1539(+)